ncbi:MAG: arginine--tRNA ligase [Chloroflexi bacterium]|nr:MAG: arginine--tRNA ligase [Chloroflexota bacterium]
MTSLIRDQVAALIVAGLHTAQEEGALPGFEMPVVAVERPRQLNHGDYASPVCLQLAKVAHMPPRQIAAQVADRIPPAPFVGQVAVAGPGYINITLDAAWLTAQVEAILAAGDSFGDLDIGRGQRYQVEFVSANPTGPIHVGSVRNAIIGDVLANVLTAAGFEVEREYYVNDAGSQVRRFGESVYASYAQALGRDEPFPEDGYRGHYIVEMGQQIAQQHGDQYLDLPRREAVRALGREGIARILVEMRRDLTDLGVEFDVWFHEKTLYESGLFDRMLQMLRDKGHIVERDDAVWFTTPDLDADAVVIRSPRIIPEPDERPTYLASDIAYAWNKLVERGFDKAIYVWGADHHGDVPRVKAAVRALGLDPERVVVILYQLVSLKRGGEEVRMSKRAGEFVTLRELLDEVGSDPIRFMLLTCTVDAAMDFDLDLAVEQSDKNPVFYVQYAHARISSILRHAVDLGWDAEAAGDVSLLTHESELTLIRKMLELPEIVALAATQLAPHHLTFYIKELAAVFHAFYRDCRVVNSEEPELTQARLMLTRAARLTLAQALALLGVDAPERM